MYKCIDCGKEYKEKPEFCECGNNIFEEFGISTPKPQKIEVKENKTPTIKKTETTENILPQKDYTYLILTIIISICIILSVIGIWHLKNISKKPEKPIEINKVQTEQINKPSVQQTQSVQTEPKNQVFSFTFGDETPEIKKETTSKPQPSKQKQEQAQTQQKQQPIKKAQKEQTKNQETKQQKVQTPKQPAVQNKNSSIAKPQTNSNNTTPQQTVPNTQVQKPKVSLPPEKTITQMPKVDTAAAKKELLQYKIALRNRISSDIDFTKVIGDGSCIITFKIDSSGKLTNRAFLKQSDNDSLNDIVYSAVMKNPAYNPPPIGYKNETLKLTVKIYGGKFQIDLS